MSRMGSFALILSALVALPLAVAQPVSRILWLEAAPIKERQATSFKVPASDWWRLRIYYDEAAAIPLQNAPNIWSSTGGGVFVSHTPTDVEHHDSYSDYFYALNTSSQRMLLLDENDDTQSAARLYYSSRSTAPNLHNDAQIKLADRYQITTLTNQSGYEAHDFQWVEATEDYVTEFSEPGLYHLEVKVPWHASYELYETLTLQRDNKQLQLSAQLDHSTRYRDSQGYSQLLSRSILVPFYVTEAEPKVRIDIDRGLYLRWLQSDASEQFLLSRNAPDTIEQARAKQRAIEPHPWATTSFFRSLPPNQALVTDAFIPLIGAVTDSAKLVLPSPRQPTREPEYFYQLPPAQTATFDLPQQIRHVPIKLTLKWPEQETTLVVRSNTGEERRLKVLPEFNRLQNWQLDNASQLALMSNADKPSHKATEVMLDFRKPYQSLSVSTAAGTEAWFRLDYKNEQRVGANEATWLDISTATRTALIKGLITGASATIPEGPLKYEVVTQWHSRLRDRAAQFAQRYASQYLSDQEFISAAEFATIRNELAATFAVELTSLADVYQQLMKLGYNFTARQLLVDIAAGAKAPLQQQAEALLLEFFAEQERWFDTEGYWAWRMLHRNEAASLQGIALSWAKQNRQREAAQLFWLLDQSDPMALHTDWTAPTNQGWRKYQAEFTGATREALLYNGDLDLYLSTVYLQDAKPLRTELSDSSRVKLTLYPVLSEPLKTAELHEVSVRINQQTFSLAIRMDRASKSLSWSQSVSQLVGLPQSYSFELDAEQLNELVIETQGFDAGVVIENSTDTESAATPELTLQLAELALAQQQNELSDTQVKQLKAETMGRALTDTQQALLNSLTRSYAWQRLDTVSSSDGIAYVGNDRWQPSSPWWQVRRALMLSQVQQGERRLADDERTDIAVGLRQPMRLTLEVRKAAEVTGPALPATIAVTTPEGSSVHQLSEQTLSLPLALSAGEHRIGLEFTEPSGALVLYRLINEQGESMLPASQVKTYRASQEQDIELFIPAHSLLRLDRYQNHDALPSHSYKWFAEDTIYQVSHQGDSEYSYYRFFVFQQQPLAPRAEVTLAEVEQQLSGLRPEPTIWPVEPKLSVYADTIYELGEQDDGTWGFALGQHVRNNFDEDIRTGREEFVDSRWNYRRRLESWDTYWSSSLQWRAHNNTNLHTLVSDSQLYWLPNKYFDAEANLNLYYQAGADNDEVQGAWSAYGSLSGRWKYYWNNRTRNELELLVFGRELSESQTPLTPIDDDIVTQYKLDHRYGLTLRDQFSYQPWLDSRVHVLGQLTLNELSDRQLIDNWAVASGWRQYLRPWRFGVDARYTRYMSDDNRRSSLSSTQLAFSVDYEWWQAQGHLWQFSFDVRHDINRNSTGAFLGISWNHTAGQGYDDFAPQNLIFSPLRQRHALEAIDTNDITINDPLEAADEN